MSMGSVRRAPDIQGFLEAAQSLKLYRRAELQDEEGASLIEQLYVDPLPHDHVLQTMVGPNTAFLIGRKGTGKSTIFQRAQYELRQRDTVVTVYIDIKTVYESSQADPQLVTRATQFPQSASKGYIEALLLYQAFLRAVISDIQSEMKKRVRRSIWDGVRDRFKGVSFEEFFESLDTLLSETELPSFADITGVANLAVVSTLTTETESATQGGVTPSLSHAPDVGASLDSKSSALLTETDERHIAQTLLRVFSIKEYILRLKDLLSSIGVQQIFVFIDDFSELPEPAMKVVVDSLLAPLNNWSDEVVKLKIAAYPGRIYYGDIDKKKIDEIALDLFELYGTSDVADMEKKAIEFTQRLLDRRISHFCGRSLAEYFETSRGDVPRQLFYATMGNPRNLGYMLFYLYENTLIYNKRITATAIRDAARRYYQEKIESYFAISRFAQETFAERSSIYSLKELLDEIASRARELRSYKGSSLFAQIPGRPPTSHFYVLAEFEPLLATLELNFFLTKYYAQKDRDGRQVSVFALNYGLCQLNAIEFGRPTGQREHRLYYVERIFDYTPILQEYVKSNQEIVCDNCGNEFDNDALPSLMMYDMLCPKCKNGHCLVINLSRKYDTLLRDVNEELLLPRTELGILHTLESEHGAMFAREIAQELDSSYQMVGKRGKILAERGLVRRSKNDQGRRTFEITDRAERIYFGAVGDQPSID